MPLPGPVWPQAPALALVMQYPDSHVAGSAVDLAVATLDRVLPTHPPTCWRYYVAPEGSAPDRWPVCCPLNELPRLAWWRPHVMLLALTKDGKPMWRPVTGAPDHEMPSDHPTVPTTLVGWSSSGVPELWADHLWAGVP